MADYSKALNEALARVVALKKTAENARVVFVKAQDDYNSAVVETKALRTKLNEQVDAALAVAGIDPEDSRVRVSE